MQFKYSQHLNVFKKHTVGYYINDAHYVNCQWWGVQVLYDLLNFQGHALAEAS